VTPRRTIAVAVLTIVAVFASPLAAWVITELLAANNSTFGHALRHPLSAVLTVAVALGICRLRRAWPAPASDLFSPARVFREKQYQLLALHSGSCSRKQQANSSKVRGPFPTLRLCMTLA